MPWEINKSSRAEIYALWLMTAPFVIYSSSKIYGIYSDLFFVYAKSPANRKWRIVISLFDLIAWSVGVYPVSKVDKPDIESESESLNSNDIISLSFTINHL